MQIDPSLLQTYREESSELLERLEADLLQLEKGGDVAEILNSVFRSVHTLKGTSAMFGFPATGAFAHDLETFLDELRRGAISLDNALTEILLQCRDHIASLLQSEEASDEAALMRLRASGPQLLTQLVAYMPGFQPTHCLPPTNQPAQSAGLMRRWKLTLRFEEDLFRYGFDPYSFIHYLRKSGEFELVRPLVDKLPDLEELNAQKCYTGFEIILNSEASEEEILDAFDFIRDSSQIELTALENPAVPHIAASPAQAEPSTPALTGTDEKTERRSSIRVDSEKLDRLVNLIGELVVQGSNARLRSGENDGAGMAETVESLTRIIDDLRETALDLRMVPIGETFRRFDRLVRDLQTKTGRRVRLFYEGGETELDKNVIERIFDPLVHLVRNAMDHGIRSAEERSAAGKPETGTIRLSAGHRHGQIYIEISDDGEGLNTERILQKAIERGLARSDVAYSDDEIHRFIFLPGFSTASSVTDISGRGVGMDVVLREVQSLRGSVEIESRKGEGTTFRLLLPLTLAIIDGFLVRAGSAFFVLPLDLVEECVDLEHAIDEGSRFISLRNEAVPFFDLNTGQSDAEHDASTRLSLVVVRSGSDRIALAVDAILGELQTVIKPLGRLFQKHPWFSGATLLGDGRPACILNVRGLVEWLERRQTRRGELQRTL
jgi:two-component system chemotaxis sensor kinase CheA